MQRDATITTNSQPRRGNKNRGHKRRRVDRNASSPSPSVPAMTIADRLKWAAGVEEPLPLRKTEDSAIARLVGALVTIYELTMLLLEAGLKNEDLPRIEPIGHSGDFEIFKVTPEGWLCLKNLVESEKLSPRDRESKVDISPPDSYLEYHDLSVVLHLDAKHLPIDVAMGYPDGIPRPIRIFRMYKNSGERAKCVRLVFKNLDQRALVLQCKKIKLWRRSRRVQAMNKPSKTPAGERRHRQGRNE